jgi:TolB-like protein/Tfp pilus assembly protein PilF
MTESGGKDQKAGGAAPGSPSSLPARTGTGTADVFISYASNDKAAADSICAALEQAGITCWIAPRDVTPGEFYADAIVEAINSSRILIVVLSVNSAGSQHVLREVERASSKRRPLVAFRLDTTPLPTGLEYFLSASHWLDASGGPIDRALPGLADAVHRLLGAPEKLGADASVNAPGIRAGTPKSRRKRLWTAAAAAVVVLLALLAGKLWLSKRSATEIAAPAASTAPSLSEKSIAVLPFTDMSEKHDQEYFGDGMADEILDVLSKVPGLKVIGRTSSFQFKGKSEDLRTIGKELGAAYVLEGSVRRAGDRVRITAQFVDARTGVQRWSESYDREFGDVLALQDEIAAGIARVLQVSVGAVGNSHRPVPANTEAYLLYLQGRHARDRRDRDGIEMAISYYQKARDLDPSYTPIAVALSETYVSQATSDYVSAREGFEQAREEAERAVRIDPTMAEAHAVLADIHTRYDWDWAAASDEIRKATALDPHNADVRYSTGSLAASLGQCDAAIRNMKEGMEDDPLSAGAHFFLGWTEFRCGRFSEADAALKKALQISPTQIDGRYILGLASVLRGEREQALKIIEAEPDEADRLAGLAVVYYSMGRKAESDAALAALTKLSADNWAYAIAGVHAYRSEIDQAFKWLERAYLQKDGDLGMLKGDPLLKHLEADPRYKAFLRKMNLPE